MAIEISGLKEVLFLFVYLICVRSFHAAEGKEPVRGRGMVPETRGWKRRSDGGNLPLPLTPRRV